MTKPEGTYLAWLDCREAGIDGQADKFFEEQAKVAMNDGAWFGKGGEGFIRLNALRLRIQAMMNKRV